MANIVRDPAQSPPDSLPGPDDEHGIPLQAATSGIRLRQHLEAAVLHQGGRRLLPTTRSMGGGHEEMEPVLRGERRGLVGVALSARQHATPDWADVRRLPLGRLRHPHQASRRMERRLRTVSRPRQRTCHPAIPRQHRESRAHGRRRGERHLYPVPLAGPAADDSARGEVLRLAGGLPRGAQDWPTIGSSRIGSSARRTSTTSRMARPTRIGCRATISRRASCTGAASRASTATTSTARAITRSSSSLPIRSAWTATALRRRTARTRTSIEKHTHHKAGQRGEPVRGVPHAGD